MPAAAAAGGRASPMDPGFSALYSRHIDCPGEASGPCKGCSAGKVAAAALQAGVAGVGCQVFEWACHNPYCGLLFRCGCTWPWSGGWGNCNVHNPTGPKCPWCNVLSTNLYWLKPAISSNVAVILMLAAYGAVWLRQLREHAPGPVTRQLGQRATAAACAFAVHGLVLGWLFFAWSTPDYPCFLWIVDDATRCGGKATL